MPVAGVCNPIYLGSGGLQFWASLGKWFKRPHVQNSQSKMDWRCGSEVKYLLCKLKALSSNHSSTKKKKKKIQNYSFLPWPFSRHSHGSTIP
jgi:hypothetical protein